MTGGAGTICSMQTRALVRLGANACIVGRGVDKTEAAARDIAAVRPGATVLGIGGCDVRKPEALQAAADRCARELGGIDFVMYVESPTPNHSSSPFLLLLLPWRADGLRDGRLMRPLPSFLSLGQ